MYAHPTDLCLAIEIEQNQVRRQAERSWQANQTAPMQRGHIEPTAVRRWIGGILIVAGQRLQGPPEMSVVTMDSEHVQRAHI